jgi:hypothetical protein
VIASLPVAVASHTIIAMIIHDFDHLLITSIIKSVFAAFCNPRDGKLELERKKLVRV